MKDCWPVASITTLQSMCWVSPFRSLTTTPTAFPSSSNRTSLRRVLVDGVGAEFGGAVEEHLVELTAFDLPRFAASSIVMLAEEERSGLGTFVGDELDALFHLPTGAANSVGESQAVERPESFGHQRFADMEPGHRFTFDQERHETGFGGDRGC